MSEITAVQFSGYGPPEVLSARRIPAPQPGAGEVSIDVHAASVNPIDWKLRAGLLQKVFPASFPVTSGRDGAGVVIAVGAGVDSGLIGRRVCFLGALGVGTWAERIVLPAALAVAIPDTLSFIDAAAVPLAGLSAWAALVTAAQIGPGVRVLIHAAAGGVGTFAVQIARNRGAHVAATCSRGNIDFVCGLGAEEVITYDDKIAFEDKLSRLDVVLDPIGGEVHRRSYAALRKGGMLVCLAAAPYQDRGAEYGVTVRLAQVAPDPAVLAALLALVPRVRPIVERILPFSDFVAAQRASQQGHARGKTVLRIR